MALDSRPKSLTLDTLLLICRWIPTFGENALRKPPKNRFLARGASALQQNLLSGKGLGGSPCLPPTSTADQLHIVASWSLLELWKWGRVGCVDRQAGRHKVDPREKQETEANVELASCLSSSSPPTERVPYTLDQFSFLLERVKSP